MTVDKYEKITADEHTLNGYDQENSPKAMNTDRRQVLKKIAVGTAALAGCSVLPETWTSPVLKFAALPAHAYTSGDIAAAAEAIVEALEGSGTDTAAVDAASAEAAAAKTAAADTATADTSSAKTAAAETAASDAAAADAASAKAASTEAAKAKAAATEAATTETTALKVEKSADVLRGYSNSLTIKNTGDKMSCDSIWQDKFVFSKLGPQYAKSFLIVWSDGRELYVPDSAHMIMEVNQSDFRKYQPGGQYSGNNPDIPSMEVYAARGTHPGSVTMYY